MIFRKMGFFLELLAIVHSEYLGQWNSGFMLVEWFGYDFTRNGIFEIVGIVDSWK